MQTARPRGISGGLTLGFALYKKTPHTRTEAIGDDKTKRILLKCSESLLKKIANEDLFCNA